MQPKIPQQEQPLTTPFNTKSLDPRRPTPPYGFQAPSANPAPEYQNNNNNSNAIPENLTRSTQFNALPHFIRPTVSKLPNSSSVKHKTHLPLGFNLQPLAIPPAGAPEVASVNLGNSVVVRCKRCRSYINPYVQWEASGRRWICNMCDFLNETPQFYYRPLNPQGQREDRFERPELSLGSVEFIAPPDYMVRPPQPPVYMFVIDVSLPSITSGAVDCICLAIKHALENGYFNGESRCLVGILTFDTTIHFYNLSSTLKQPQMVVVSNLQDIFLPLSDSILVPAVDSRETLCSLVESLPNMWRQTKINQSCWGTAMRAAHLAMKHIGGKMLLFGSTVPTVGEFLLKPTRDAPKAQPKGATSNPASREIELLKPENDAYKLFAERLTKAQISVDLFLFPTSGIDLATLAPIAKFSSGDTHYYPHFNVHEEGSKLQQELLHTISRPTGWEAVMRFRVSKGWKITKWFGNFFFRGADLLVIPSCHSDQTFAITIDLEENVIQEPVAYLQSALLYTNSEGERRIRIHSFCLPISQQPIEICNSMDPQVVASFIAHQAIETALKSNLTEARNMVQSTCAQILSANPGLGPLARALSLYVFGFLKSASLRDAKDVSSDMRIFHWNRLEVLPIDMQTAYFYPRLIALHNLAPDVGILDDMDECYLPPSLSLTSEQMMQDGAYLLDNGELLMMWIGKGISSTWVEAVFNVRALEHVNPDYAETTLEAASHPLGLQVRAIIHAIRKSRKPPYQKLLTIRQGDPAEHQFFSSLIEDRTHSLMLTYQDFLAKLGPRVSQPSPAPGTYGTAPIIHQQQPRHY